VVTETKIFQTPNLVPLDFCLWIGMQPKFTTKR